MFRGPRWAPVILPNKGFVMFVTGSPAGAVEGIEEVGPDLEAALFGEVELLAEAQVLPELVEPADVEHLGRGPEPRGNAVGRAWDLREGGGVQIRVARAARAHSNLGVVVEDLRHALNHIGTERAVEDRGPEA